MSNKFFIFITLGVVACWAVVSCQESSTTATSGVPVESVDTITITPTVLNLTKGNSAQLSTSVTSTTSTMVWTSSDTSVVKVDAEGNVTAVSDGSAVITATLSGKSGSCPVTVTNEAVSAKSVALSTPDLVLSDIGQSYQLTSTVLPTNATNVTYTWTSSAADVAMVSASGLVTAVGAGSAEITVTTSNGLTAVCTVAVSAASGTVTTYSVNTSKCAGCGDCLPCPQGAITITNRKAYINASKCTGCGQCYSRCRHNAITATTTSGIKDVTL
jgi:uncharacterized protein YjdB